MKNSLALQSNRKAERLSGSNQLFYRQTLRFSYNKLFLFFLIFSLLPAAILKAGNESTDIDYHRTLLTANKLYKAEKFNQAFKAYEQDNISAPNNPYTLYNMGNCQFRMENLSLSILYYAKAFNLLPRNNDIRHNLEFSLNQTGQKLVQDGTPLLLHKIFYFFALSELKAMTYIIFWLLCLLLSAAILKRNIRSKIWPPFIYLVSIFAIFFIWGTMRAASRFESAGVIMESDTPILSGPGKSFKTYASLPAGRLVKITDIPGSVYIQIGLPEKGLKGWIEKTALKKI
jgi:tetratricopeptide (TPR) repeat protein